MHVCAMARARATTEGPIVPTRTSARAALFQSVTTVAAAGVENSVNATSAITATIIAGTNPVPCATCESLDSQRAAGTESSMHAAPRPRKSLGLSDRAVGQALSNRSGRLAGVGPGLEQPIGHLAQGDQLARGGGRHVDRAEEQ